MEHGGFFFQAFIYLSAAVISVPIAKRLGLGSVLGYLIAGIIIGPYALHLVGEEGQDVMHFAEFGVVMMLFLIGLVSGLSWHMALAIGLILAMSSTAIVLQTLNEKGLTKTSGG